jgi:hypothetical protein
MLHCRYCSAMNDIVEQVLSSADPGVGPEARERLINYLRLLASTGLTRRQLERFGRAYLQELLTPDRRYSGC